MRAEAPSKARLVCVDNPMLSFSLQFNPSSLKLGRQVSWAAQPVHGQGWPTLQFSHGESDTLDATLLLDESEGEASVLPLVRSFYALTEPTFGSGGGGPRPGCVLFTWEDFRFLGVVKSVQVEFLLFDAAGRPKRASASVSLAGKAFAEGGSVGEFFGQVVASIVGSSSLGARIEEVAAGLDPRLSIVEGF